MKKTFKDSPFAVATVRFLLLLSLSGFFAGCVSSTSQQPQHYTVDQLAQLIQANEPIGEVYHVQPMQADQDDYESGDERRVQHWWAAHYAEEQAVTLACWPDLGSLHFEAIAQ